MLCLQRKIEQHDKKMQQMFTRGRNAPVHSTSSTYKKGTVAMHTTRLQEDSAKGAFQLVDEREK